MNTICRLQAGFAFVLATSVGAAATPADRPNILWLVTEDIGPNLGAYGDPDAITPALDGLAARGLRYTKVFTVAGVCAPSRSSLITGLYASSLGSQHMRSVATLPTAVRILPARLREAGYYCSNNFKEDYNFATPAGAWDESSRTAHWRKRPAGRPFFSVFNFMVTHEQYLRAPPELFARVTQKLTPAQRRVPAKVTLPAWLPDTPAVRREWARYHEMITAMDYRVAELLAELAADGLAANTIVFFFGDNGPGLPRAKQFLYDSGTHVPLIVYCPPRWQHLLPPPGSVSDRLVSLFDVMPTVLALAGLRPPADLEARVLLGPAAAPPREFVYGIRDRMDERIDFSRTVRDARFKYHRNYRPDLPHYPWLEYMDKLDTAQEFRRLAREGRLPTGLKPFMAGRQGLEELYDLGADPDELRNLAGDPAYGAELARMRAAHFAWMRETRDTGFIPEQMLRDLAAGATEFAYARSPAYQLEKCIATTRLMEEGRAGLPSLVRATADPYPPVRYWAAIGLGVLGREGATAVPALTSLLRDTHAEVALAAAEALGQMGEAAAALPTVARWLESGRPLESLAASNVADRLGEAARPIADTLRRVAAFKPAGDLGLMRQWVLLHALKGLDAPWRPTAAAGALLDVGLARIDITPTHPIRLHAFPRGDRVPETSEVTKRIHAKALAIGADKENPVLLVAADLLGISEEMSSELARRLAERVGFKDRARLTFSATHNHSAPAVATMAPYVFRQPPTPEAARNIARYGAWVLDRLEEVARQALADRRPAQLHYACGQVGFAINRRVLKDGRCVGFGINPAGPVDHDLPMLCVREPDGTVRGVWLSYACHGICWRKPSVHSDWMGVAQEIIEKEYPGATALVTIGCAGDQSPEDAEGNDPETPGRAIALEIARLLAQPGRAVSRVPAANFKRLTVPLAPIPGPDYWAKQTDWYGRTVHAQILAGKPPVAATPFVVQTWTFGQDLAVVFLSGEVLVGYGLRLKSDFDRDRLWVDAYANAMPGYIPTARVIPEGGWEVDDSRKNYGLPSRFAPATEDLIIGAVHDLLPAEFRTKAARVGAGK